jgi:hypothetical protein
MISNDERINLQKLVGEFESEDNTEYIRKLKHSVKIRNDIEQIERLKQGQPKQSITSEDAMKVAPFLYSNYTDIFHRVVKGDLNLDIMDKVLSILGLIETGKVDQHEGSVLVGRLLKEMYLDSAVRRADRLDEEHSSSKEDEEEKPSEGKPVSWKEFKRSSVGRSLENVEP